MISRFTFILHVTVYSSYSVALALNKMYVSSYGDSVF